MDTIARGTAPAASTDAAASSSSPADHGGTAAAHLSPILGRYFQVSWSHGEGHRLFDTAGKSYLDFANGIATTSLGHAHPRVTAAIHEQVDRLVHVSNAIGYVEPVSRFSARLAEAFPEPLDTVFLANSGAEAIEAAIKLARRVTGRPGVVAFTGGFHGRTFGAASLTSSNLNYRTGYEPFVPGVYLAPFPNVYRDFGGDEAAAVDVSLARLEAILAQQIPPSAVAAFVIEPVQGEGGYNPAQVAFLRGLRELADRHGILLVADEVQTGYARTGRMWGFEHAEVVPDIVCLAKAIANGLPLSAVVTRRELQARWGVGAHGSTFGGNPVACAAAIAVLDTIRDENLVENARRMGTDLTTGLRKLMMGDERIGDVRGPGLMIGVEFVKDRTTREPDGDLADAVIAAAAERGLLLLTCGTSHQVIRWIAPIDVTAEEVDEALAVFAAALESKRAR